MNQTTNKRGKSNLEWTKNLFFFLITGRIPYLIIWMMGLLDTCSISIFSCVISMDMSRSLDFCVIYWITRQTENANGFHFSLSFFFSCHSTMFQLLVLHSIITLPLLKQKSCFRSDIWHPFLFFMLETW